MIIADTNVWVSFLKGEKKAFLLKDMIIENEVILHPYIYGELLLGGIAQKVVPLLQSLETLSITDEQIVYYFIMKNKMQNRGIGWVDVNLLVSALSEKHRIFTFDANLAVICKEFKCHID
ncbi:MAG TPA: PIN domain-containing protein [Spirochaetota bacterium]|nr:PIN domain-containing protein [Spirochaetota bacterium]